MVADWLAAGDVAAAESGRIDEGPLGDHEIVVDVETVDVLDLFSAGNRVAFHATGTLTGNHGIGEAARPAHIDVAGMATVEDGAVRHVRVVTDRFGLSLAVR